LASAERSLWRLVEESIEESLENRTISDTPAAATKAGDPIP
jgi:hypothetical protein